MYLQCPTDFSLLWHLTKKNLMVRYFSPCIHLRSTLSESVWKRRVDGCERLCSGDIFPVHQGDCFFSFSIFFFWMCAPLSSPSIKKKKNNLPLHTKKKKNKETQNLSCSCLQSNNSRSEKEWNSSISFFYPAGPREPSFRTTEKNTKSKHMCTLKRNYAYMKCEYCLLQAVYGLDNRTEYHTHHFIPDEDQAADTGSEWPSERPLNQIA